MKTEEIWCNNVINYFEEKNATNCHQFVLKIRQQQPR